MARDIWRHLWLLQGECMQFRRLLPLAALLLVPFAFAQSTSCPELPASTGLTWDRVDGAGFTFCKAIRDTDGQQAFAVMLRPDAQFRTRRSHREGDRVLIDGHEVFWYRGDVQNGMVRETLIELDRNSTAHIVVRADSEPELSEAQRAAQGLRFRDARLGSN